MGNRPLDRREEFEGVTFPHLQALWTTGLWLTKRASHADQLLARTVTQAYLSWKVEGIPADSRVRLYRTLTREFSASSRPIRPLDWAVPEHFTAPSDGGNGDQPRPATSVDRQGLVLFNGISPIAVKGAIARLRPLSRLIMILHFRERFSYAEIACITDLQVGSVKAILNRARRLVPQYLLRHRDKVVTESIRDAADLARRVSSEDSP